MSPAPLSNRLAHLAHEIGVAFGRGRQAVATAYAEAGPLLIEAKAECRHGQWLAFLELATINERVAQRAMRLAAAGMTVDAIMAAGGVDAALRSIRQRKSEESSEMPDPQTADPPAGEADDGASRPAPDIEAEPWRGMSADDALRWLVHAASPSRPSFGARGYALRERGLKWIEIALALEYRPDLSRRRERMRATRSVVRHHAQRHGRRWPLPRPDHGQDEP